MATEAEEELKLDLAKMQVALEFVLSIRARHKLLPGVISATMNSEVGLLQVQVALRSQQLKILEGAKSGG